MSGITGSCSTSSDAGTQELLRGVLGPLIRALTASGVDASAIRDVTEAALNQASIEFGNISAIHLGSIQRDCMEVMCAWRRHPDFLTEQGRPAKLKTKGPSPSFVDLCNRAKIKNPVDLVLETLVQFDAVSVENGGYVEPQTPTFLLGAGNSSTAVAVDGLLKQLAGFVRVIEHNIVGVANGRTARFERSCSVAIAEELVPIAHRVVRERGQEFIDGIDEWLERRSRYSSPSNKYIEVGVGAYLLDLGERGRSI